MRPLRLLQLRTRISFDHLVTLVITILAAALIIGFQVLRLLGRSGNDDTRGSA